MSARVGVNVGHVLYSWATTRIRSSHHLSYGSTQAGGGSKGEADGGGMGGDGGGMGGDGGGMGGGGEGEGDAGASSPPPLR